MEDFIAINQQEILATSITFVVLLVLKFVSTKTIRKIGRISDLNQARTRLVLKYVSIAYSLLVLEHLFLSGELTLRK
jgi:heme/copper-type cytochrome/quinol oxidase subunit 2